jgi:hypothetical protein
MAIWLSPILTEHDVVAPSVGFKSSILQTCCQLHSSLSASIMLSVILTVGNSLGQSAGRGWLRSVMTSMFRARSGVLTNCRNCFLR